MANETQVPANYVKKETMLLVAAIALLAGFLAGIVFTVYKSDTGEGTPTVARQEAPPQQPRLTAEQTQRVLTLEREVANNPDNMQAWIELGHLYFDGGEFPKAITAYEKALAINPDQPHILTDLGVMYRRSGQPQKALEHFEKAIELDPRLEQPRFNKGVVLLFDLNQKEAALEAWRKVLELNPNATAPNGQPLREVVEQVAQSEEQAPSGSPQQQPSAPETDNQSPQ